MKNTMLNILACQCPRCHEGKLFVNSPGFNISSMTKMNDRCEVCGLELAQEPGYYYGAMYVSYAFATAELVITLSALYFLVGGLSLLATMAVITAVFLLLLPFNFRWGRAGWIAVFHRYDPEARKRKEVR